MNPEHGTNSRYCAGCHCEECRQAHTQYIAHWRTNGPNAGTNLHPPKRDYVPADQDWLDQAACRGSDPRLFFADQRGDHYTEARAICTACPVRTECLDYAIALGARQPGFWGGHTERQRDSIRRKRDRDTKAAA